MQIALLNRVSHFLLELILLPKSLLHFILCTLTELMIQKLACSFYLSSSKHRRFIGLKSRITILVLTLSSFKSCELFQLISLWLSFSALICRILISLWYFNWDNPIVFINLNASITLSLLWLGNYTRFWRFLHFALLPLIQRCVILILLSRRHYCLISQCRCWHTSLFPWTQWHALYLYRSLASLGLMIINFAFIVISCCLRCLGRLLILIK